MRSLKYELNKADMYKELIDKKRPLDKEEIRQLDEYFKLELTYSSNSLEGNTLTLSETKVILENGITIGGKPILDCYEATGHAKAYDYMLSMARADEFKLSEEIIKKLHALFFSAIDIEEAGNYRKIQAYISGTEYIPPTAIEVPGLMKEFVEEANKLKENMHPIEYAAYVHKVLVDIHPFINGNGRTARLLMNMVLVNAGYGVVSIPPVLKHEYNNALIISQRYENPSDIPFFKLIAECVNETEKDYCRLLRIDTKEVRVRISKDRDFEMEL